MFSPTKKQISTFIGGAVLAAMASILAYAAFIFAPSSQPIGYIAQPTVYPLNVPAGGAQFFRGEYSSLDWSGKFDCYVVGSNGYVNLNSNLCITGTSAPIDTQSKRNIYTNTSTSVASTGVVFAYANLNATQKALMGTTTTGPINVAWMNGTPQTGLRTRATDLGDIIHSKPVYFPDSTYPTVFVGANDGMLHAFDASSSVTAGTERWAYIPSMLIPKLASTTNALWSANYTHDYFVDGGIAVKSLAAQGANPAVTILVGALGAGGKGLYALDVTDLTAASGTAAGATKLAKWEITNASSGYADLGYTYSNPIIVPTEDGNDSVIVGNGYNNSGSTGGGFLYVINARTGAQTAKISLPSDTGTVLTPNGLSTPYAVDANHTGKAGRVYAGDINGDMWVFNLTGSNTANWYAKKLYSTGGKSITQAPVVSNHPNGGYMVNFATGRILSGPSAAVIASSVTAAGDDTADTSINSAYGIWDNLSGTTVTSIVTQTLAPAVYPSAGATAASQIAVRNVTSNVAPDWITTFGWQADFPVGGERVTGDGAIVNNNRFLFNATNPTISYIVGGSSTSSKGVNWMYALDFLAGNARLGLYSDLNHDGALNNQDRLMNGAGNTVNLASSGVPVAYLTTNGVQSQPILINLGSASIPLYNNNSNALASKGKQNTTGVSGGHFDVDISYGGLSATTGGGNSTDTHWHEYDKVYDTNGLNFLNPNDATLALSNAVSSATTSYKVLVMNQGWNRAMNLRIGTWSGSTRDYQTGLPTDVFGSIASSVYYTASKCVTAGSGVGCLNVGSLPSYTGNTSTVGPTLGVDYTIQASAVGAITGKINVINVSTTGSISCLDALGKAASGVTCTTTTTTTGARASVGGLEFSMPSDGFNIQNWWNTGNTADVMTGVMPTQPSCPDNFGNNGATPAYKTGAGTKNTGPAGERHDGVITVQIISSATPATAVQMNVPGNPLYGFRVIDSQYMTYVYAEYTLYWHHPMKVCYGDTSSSWTTTNNSGDPWWPAQSKYTDSPSGTYTTLGPLKCIGNNDSWNNNTSNSVSWGTTAPVATPTLVWPETLISPGTGNVPWPPKGFTMQPPMDTATTYPPCPTYAATADDPRTASFILGGTTTTTTSSVVTTTTVNNGVGGSLYGAANGTGAGGTVTTNGGAVSGSPNTATVLPNGMTARRITWRELIGL